MSSRKQDKQQQPHSLEQVVSVVIRQGQKLGTGGMSADIYTGTFRGGNYLLKVLKEQCHDRPGQNQDAVYRSIQERMSSRCKRFFPHYYGSTRLPDGRLVLVMDHRPGSMDLFEFLRQDKPLTRKERLEIGRRLIEGVRCLHENGIVHGDLKPENVIIDPATLEIMFIDFGYSGSIQRKDYVLLGTPAYYAPQNRDDYEKQVSGKIYQQYDLWVLGLMLLWVIGETGAFIRIHVDKDLAGLAGLDGRLRSSFPEYPDLSLLTIGTSRRIIAGRALEEAVEQINRAFRINWRSGQALLQKHPEILRRVEQQARNWSVWQARPWQELSTGDKYHFYLYKRQEKRLEQAMKRIDGLLQSGEMDAVQAELEKEPDILSKMSHLYWNYTEQGHDKEWEDLRPAQRYAYYRRRSGGADTDQK
ncbi:hypothetical protein EBZ80_08875 [bacterium]|nr:hypothetical protein [bacterium]